MPRLYHASPTENRSGIRQSGLRGSDGRIGHGVYFVFTEGQAHTIGHSRQGPSAYDIWSTTVSQDHMQLVAEHPPWAGLDEFREVLVQECYARHPHLVYKGTSTSGTSIAQPPVCNRCGNRVCIRCHRCGDCVCRCCRICGQDPCDCLRRQLEEWHNRQEQERREQEARRDEERREQDRHEQERYHSDSD
ncbi:unnamed protein product [Symbiodinium microadriaticum]|nr:unnamed protein product [Symbiodinium microadriaticum]